MNSFALGVVKIGRASIMMATAGLWLAVPAAAQVAPVNNGTSDAIGPDQLRTFSLGGKTAPVATPPPPPVQPDLIPPAANRPQRRSAPAPTPTFPTPLSRPATAPQVAATGVQPTVVTLTPAQRAAAPRPTPAAGKSVTVALPPADPLSRKPTPANEADTARMSSQPIGVTAPLPSGAGEDESGALMPWLLALLLIAGGALLFAFRGRFRAIEPEPMLAGAPFALPPELPPRSFPPPPPPPVAPLRAPLSGGITIKRPDGFAPRADPVPPRGTAPQPIGIISSKLRPWLEIDFEPSQAVIDPGQASVQFDVVVTNSGSAPARQVLVEACMVNAGPEQDAELRRFFEAPVGVGDRIAAIPPLGKIALKSAVSLPLDQVRAYEVGGRKLFVPLVAFNALYEWGSSGGQSSAAFILGRSTSANDGEGESDGRMAPLRLDLGPRSFRDLEGRRHPLGMRR